MYPSLFRWYIVFDDANDTCSASLYCSLMMLMISCSFESRFGFWLGGRQEYIISALGCSSFVVSIMLLIDLTHVAVVGVFLASFVPGS